MDEKQTEKIEAYLEGKLSILEKEAFESQLEQDPNLRAALKNHQQMVNAIQETEFRRVLKEIQQQKKGTNIRRINPFLLGVAASVVLLVGAFWIFTPSQEQKLMRQLAAVDLDPGLPTTLSSTTNPSFAEGMNAYKLQDYEMAKQWWQPLLAESPVNDTLLFYMAQIDLATSKYQSAQQQLQALLNQPKSIFFEKSRWYLAVVLLREGKKEEAARLLRDIQQTDPLKSNAAENLLKYIE